MKVAFLIAALALLAGLGWRFAWPGGEVASPVDSPKTDHDAPGTVIRDGAEVFRKAFWKHPTTDDRILHAERRVWSDDEQVEKWQWFLVLEPSPALVKYLREDNAFSLTPASSPAATTHPPTWFAFPPEDVEILQSPGGDMQLIFEKKRKILYATGAGGGFAKAVHTPAPP